MRERHDAVVGRLAGACLRGDVDAIRAVLTADAVAVCDGIGREPVRGAGEVARLVALLLSPDAETELSAESVNGRPGLALRCAGRAVAVAAVQPAGDRIAVVWIQASAAKLDGWHRR